MDNMQERHVRQREHDRRHISNKYRESYTLYLQEHSSPALQPLLAEVPMARSTAEMFKWQLAVLYASTTFLLVWTELDEIDDKSSIASMDTDDYDSTTTKLLTPRGEGGNQGDDNGNKYVKPNDSPLLCDNFEPRLYQMVYNCALCVFRAFMIRFFLFYSLFFFFVVRWSSLD